MKANDIFFFLSAISKFGFSQNVSFQDSLPCNTNGFTFVLGVKCSVHYFIFRIVVIIFICICILPGPINVAEVNAAEAKLRRAQRKQIVDVKKRRALGTSYESNVLKDITNFNCSGSSNVQLSTGGTFQTDFWSLIFLYWLISLYIFNLTVFLYEGNEDQTTSQSILSFSNDAYPFSNITSLAKTSGKHSRFREGDILPLSSGHFVWRLQ